jgi:hypothetical protein
VVDEPDAIGLGCRYPVTRHAHLCSSPPPNQLGEEETRAQVGAPGPDVDVLGARKDVETSLD